MDGGHNVFILLGPPSSGKGTQAVRICQNLGFVHLSSGDVFRQAIEEGTELGREAKRYIDAGELVPDGLTSKLMLQRLEAVSRQDRTPLLDGFPRTLQQAKLLRERLKELGISLRTVLYIDVSDEEIYRRAALRGRADDARETVARRLEVFRRQTLPAVDSYKTQGLLMAINGEQAIEAVEQEIMGALKARV